MSRKVRSVARVRKRRDHVDAPYTIVCDTREQAPYSFEGFHADAKDSNLPLIVPTRRACLGAGDYSLLGHESSVAVERKSLSDAFGTIGGGRDRFERELARLAEMDYAAVVIEATWERILSNPPMGSQLAPKVVLRSAMAWQQRFPSVHWWAVDGRRFGEAVTLRILERYWKDREKKNAAAD